jgi:hypothetical protein
MTRLVYVAGAVALALGASIPSPASASVPSVSMSAVASFSTAAGCTQSSTGDGPVEKSFSHKATVALASSSTATNGSDATDTVMNAAAVTSTYKTSTKHGSLSRASLQAGIAVTSLPHNATTACQSTTHGEIDVAHSFALKRAGTLSLDVTFATSNTSRASGAYVQLSSAATGEITTATFDASGRNWGTLRLAKGNYTIDVTSAANATTVENPGVAASVSLTLAFAAGK